MIFGANATTGGACGITGRGATALLGLSSRGRLVISLDICVSGRGRLLTVVVSGRMGSTVWSFTPNATKHSAN